MKARVHRSGGPSPGGGGPPSETGPAPAARYPLLLGGAVLLLIAAAAVSLAVGRYAVPLTDSVKIVLSRFFPIRQTWENINAAVVLDLRLPRTAAAAVVGAGLALSGATYQSIFKNPMCSPDLLGVSSGACIGAALAILWDCGSMVVQLGAFAGGLLAVAATVSIPRLMRNDSSTVLILSGIVVSSLMSSVMSILKFVADTDTKLAEITYWTMGSFAAVKFDTMAPVLPTILLPGLVILLMRYRLNVLSLGDSEAHSLGVDLRKTRGVFILCSTLITASSVCMAGTIGWVGLVIPHISRMLVGSDNKKMLPVAMAFGGVFMLLIDMLCRTITAAELKLSILTGVIGAPFFVFILVKQSGSLK